MENWDTIFETFLNDDSVTVDTLLQLYHIAEQKRARMLRSGCEKIGLNGMNRLCAIPVVCVLDGGYTASVYSVE